MFNVLIADSHPIARTGLQIVVERVAELLRDECVIAFSDDAFSTFRKAKRLQPDLILLSTTLPLTGGPQTVSALRAYAPRTKVLVLSDDEDSGDLSALLEAGAHGVLSKGESTRALEERIGALLTR
ncbi:MAG TPA: response regulator transcription factor [Gammaproteobacteria bacterium]|nr:response regulator transcription factor [Gammaproteobacteria bacterium]